jgi:hypothetical protein
MRRTRKSGGQICASFRGDARALAAASGVANKCVATPLLSTRTH